MERKPDRLPNASIWFLLYQKGVNFDYEIKPGNLRHQAL